LFHADRRTDRQTDRQIDRQTDRQTDTTKLTVAIAILRTRLKCNGICVHYITEVMANFCIMHFIQIYLNTVILKLTKSCDALMILCSQIQRTESCSPSLYHNRTGMKSDLGT